MTVYIEFRGKRLYIHGHNRFFYLSYQKEGSLDEIPEGYKIVYNKCGLPFVKRTGK